MPWSRFTPALYATRSGMPHAGPSSDRRAVLRRTSQSNELLVLVERVVDVLLQLVEAVVDILLHGVPVRGRRVGRRIQPARDLIAPRAQPGRGVLRGRARARLELVDPGVDVRHP